MNHIIFNYIVDIFATIGFIAVFSVLAGYVFYRMES